MPQRVRRRLFKEEGSYVLNKVPWQEMCLESEINANF
jgi:hypothetical protein